MQLPAVSTKHVPVALHLSGSYIPMYPLLQWSLSLWREEWGVYVSFRAEHSFSLLFSIRNFAQLWVCALITIYYKCKCLWWGLRYTLIYGYNDRSLGVDLILWPFSSHRSRFYPRVCNCLVIGSGPLMVSSMGFILWSVPLIQSESSCLLRWHWP